jgi:hypothetical protein
MMTIASTSPEPYRVLFLDPFIYRHPKFRIDTHNREKWAVSQYHAYNSDDFLKQLKHQWKWDVLFFPAYVVGHREGHPQPSIADEQKIRERLVDAVCRLGAHQRPRLIIFHGMRDDYGTIDTFRAAGFDVAHKPFTDKHAMTVADPWEDD